MLKDHDPSENLQPTPNKRGVTRMGHEVAGRTPPLPDKTKTRAPRPDRSLEALRALNVDTLNVSTEPVTKNDEDAFKKAITVEEIKFFRASIFEAEQSLSGETPLACEMLGSPPKSTDIIDVFSSILGDIFHAMDRCKISVKSALKKAYFVALMNAFFIWDEEIMDELRQRMKDSGMTEKEIDAELYFNCELFKGCVPRRVPPPSVLYWRVRAVFVTYGQMIDSETGRPLFNAQAWKKAKNVLKEIRAGLYSGTICFVQQIVFPYSYPLQQILLMLRCTPTNSIKMA